MRRLASAALLLGALAALPASGARAPRPMSFSNRLLLNRAAVNGLATIEVMLIVRAGADDDVARRVVDFGGHTMYADRRIGYARVQLPTERAVEAVDDERIEAYQISSASRGSWYRDGPPQMNAEMYRGFERVIPNVEPQPARASTLPPLSAAQADAAGYTANEDAGVGDWFRAHPTFDGRGVTIALLESGQPEFRSPVLAPAKSLDGRDVAKLAGIVDTVGEDEPDDTRVELSTVVDARASWNRIGDRTYALPRRGRYRFGVWSLPLASNLVSQFAVLRDERTGELWVDANGNADFRDEPPVPDVNDRFEVRALHVPYPTPIDVGFVVGRGRTPETVHVYVSRSSHQTMTLSVAAGSRTADGLAYGVAPGARVLLVRYQTPDLRLRDFVEGYLEAAKRPDVDILCDSTGLLLVPDTADDFIGLLFRRLVAAYGKPIFEGAGNMSSWLASVSADGDAFAVSGAIGPATFAALYGGGSLDRVMVHPVGAAGPSIDGAVKPDFIAPVHRLAASLATAAASAAVPKNAPAASLPSGYQISCCTSATAPYAAGVAALLLSAARQEKLTYSFDAFSRALRFGARFLENAPAHRQGNGVLDVDASWRDLNRRVVSPRIVVSAPIVHPLASYGAHAAEGAGLFEREGWIVGMTGVRPVSLRRETGPDAPITYRLSWIGNDGTFATADAIRLPLDETMSLPVAITTRSAGVHSAILNMHDSATGALVARMLATVVAAERFDRQETVRVAGRVPLLATQAHYVTVPPGVTAMAIDLDVTHGSVRAHVVPSHGLFPSYYGHVYPQGGRTFTPGVYHVTMPNPIPGNWAIAVENTSAWTETDRTLVSTEPADYAVTVQLLHAALQTRPSGRGEIAIQIANHGAPLVDPLVTAALATVDRHRGDTLASGLPNLFPIDVPAGTETLTLDVRATGNNRDRLELYAYDCTTGECFSYNFTLPAEPDQRVVIRRPARGRWIAAVNAAPSPRAGSPFQLSVTLAARVIARAAPRSVTPGARDASTATLRIPETIDAGQAVLVELIDRALERNEHDHPWETRALLPKFADRPVAIGMTMDRAR